MAETKTRASSTRGKAPKRKPSKARKTSTAKSSNGASASRATKSRVSRVSKAKRSSASKNGTARVGAARDAVEETARHAGHSVGDVASTVGRAASKAKTPLLAGSAAVAGVAGGIALGRSSKSRSRRPKVKIDSHDLAKAAKEVGQFGVDVGQLASELRRNREAANGARQRSPIEVVLSGLTNRGHGSD
jgi:hypothetical protein